MNANLTVSTSTPTGVMPEAAHSVLAVIAMSVAGAADLFARWRRRAADREHLLTLDDGMLRDIGLSRSDIETEAGKPFWRA
jgi:uncharacterized protein YjiS (DUF1127 family)